MKELLERIIKHLGAEGVPNYALIIDIEAELAKPDPEPKGYTGCGLNLISSEDFEKLQTGLKLLYDTPLYEHPPEQRNPLSEEQIDDLRCRYSNIIIGHKIDLEEMLDFARVIEKAHGIE